MLRAPFLHHPKRHIYAESFRNALARGADPRLDTKDEMRRAADAGERSADGIEELVRTGLIGVATIA